MHFCSKTLHVLLLFCAYGVIESFGQCWLPSEYTSDERYEIGKPLDIIYTLKRKELQCGDVEALAENFQSANKTFDLNGWEDPHNYIEFAREFYDFLTRFQDLLRQNFILNFNKYSDPSLYKKCMDKNVKTLNSTDFIGSSIIRYLKLEDDPHLIAAANIFTNGLDEAKTKALCNIVTTSLVIPSNNLTSNGTIRVFGRYVRLSYVFYNILEVSNVQTIEVFASDTFIVDENFTYENTKPINMIVMSPAWQLSTENFWSPRETGKGEVINIVLKSDEAGSSFFGIGQYFEDKDNWLKVNIYPKPTTNNSVTIYPIGFKSADNSMKIHFNQIEENMENISLPQIHYDYHAVLNDYIKFLLENRSNSRSRIFFKNIYTSFKPNLTFFNALGFVQELLILNDISLYETDINLGNIYSKLMERVRDYRHIPRPDESSLEYDELISAIEKTIETKTDLFLLNDNVILNLRKFVNDSLHDRLRFGKLLESEKGQDIMAFKEDMKKQIVEEIKETQSFIQNELVSQVNLLNERIDGQLEATFQAIVDLKKNVSKIAAERQSKITQAKAYQLFKAAAATITVIGSLLTGNSLILLTGIGLTSGVLAEIFDAPEIPEIKLPNAVNNVEKFIEAKTRVLNSMVNILDDVKLRSLQDVRTAIMRKLTAMKNGNSAAPFHEINNLLKKKESELNRSLSKPNSSFAISIINRLSKMLHAAQATSPSTYLKYAGDNKKLQVLYEVSDLYNSSEVNQVDQYERNVHHLLAPLLQNFINFTSGVNNLTSLNSMTKVYEWEWQVRNLLQDIHFQISMFTEDIVEGELLLQTIHKLTTALNLIFDLLNRIAAYRKDARFVDFVGNVNAAHFKRREYKNNRINNAMQILEDITKGDKVILRYKKAYSTFKLYAFPFTVMLDDLDDLDFSKQHRQLFNPKDLAVEADTQMSYLSVKLDTYGDHITSDTDADILEDNFDGISQDVFYEWSLQDGFVSLEKEKFFNGTNMDLFAGVRNGVKKDAVKFNKIGIDIKLHNPDKQDNLQELLKNFDVVMKHSGSSYYTCNGHAYIAESGPVSIRFSLEKKQNGEPVRMGKTYKLLRDNDYILSPYTEWSIKLVPKVGDFSDIRKFANENINISLVGHGQYVVGPDACSDDIGLYYFKEY